MFATGTWTYTLSGGKITISNNDGIRSLDIFWVAGNPTFKGDLTIQGLPSSAVSLSATNSHISTGGNEPVAGEIDATTGSVIIVGRR